MGDRLSSNQAHALPQAERALLPRPGDSFLVAGTDGVGTKLKLAFELGKHDTIGIDLVAMSVNDIITSGAKPLFFLDYFATGKLDVDQAEAVRADPGPWTLARVPCTGFAVWQAAQRLRCVACTDRLLRMGAGGEGHRGGLQAERLRAAGRRGAAAPVLFVNFSEQPGVALCPMLMHPAQWMRCVLYLCCSLHRGCVRLWRLPGQRAATHPLTCGARAGLAHTAQTAEMPGFYAAGEYGVAGFAVGAVARDAVIDGARIAEGDVLLGFPSSGVHSNGFSLVRKVLEVLLCLLCRTAWMHSSTNHHRML